MIKKEDIKPFQKHNALTDGYIPNTGNAVLPDKLVNTLFWKFEQEGENFILSMSELRKLLGLKSTKDDGRIIEAIKLLQTPIVIRDFTFKGKGVEWTSAPFLSRATKWKDGQKYIQIKLDDMIIEGIKQKYGYTPLELNLCNSFKSKYGLKLYEMFVRYYHLPNREGAGVGTISRNIDELNKTFDSHYKQPSELLRGIKRGLKEIQKITKEEVTCFYNKHERKFIFGWEQVSKYPNLRIPYKRIDELIAWYLEHNSDKLNIKSIEKYKQSLKNKIINDEFSDLDTWYRGLLQHKYNLNYKDFYEYGKYKDFNIMPKKDTLL
jgi:hypothetical protein